MAEGDTNYTAVVTSGRIHCDGALTVAGLVTLSGGFTIDSGDFTFTGANINFDPTGSFLLDMDAGQAFSVDVLGAASNLTLATSAGAQDLTVAVTGAFDSSLVLANA